MLLEQMPVRGRAGGALLLALCVSQTTAWGTPLRVRALTVLTLAAGLASTIFAPVASTLAGALGWRAGFLVLAGSIRGSRSRVAGNRRRTAGSPDRRGDTSRRRARIADPHPSRGGRRTLGNSQAWPAQRYFHCTHHRRPQCLPPQQDWAGDRHWVLSRGAAGRRGRMRTRHDRRCRQWFTRSNRRLRLSVHLIGAERELRCSVLLGPQLPQHRLLVEIVS
jgi:hypothetical protein